MARKSSVSLTGFGRKSTAPAFIASTLIGILPWPVMKTIGTLRFKICNSRCRSMPVSPGMRTSSTRQAASWPPAPGLEELPRRYKSLYLVARRLDETRQGSSHRRVVIN